VTDQNQIPEQQGTPQSPQEGAVPTPDGTVSPESVDESLDETLELPKISVDPQQTAVTAPVVPTPEPQIPLLEPAVPVLPVVSEVDQPTAVTPVVPEQLQPTAVVPQVPPAPPPAQAAPVEGVTPTQGLVPPPVDIDQTLSDTSDFTLTDITLGDAGGGLTGWLHGLKSRLSPTSKTQSVPVAAPVTKTRRWGLRAWQWALVSIGAIVFVLAVLVAVDGGLYYGKVHHGISVAGQHLSGMTATKATETLTTFAEEAQTRPITLKSEDGAHTWTILPGDLGTSIDVPAAVAKAMALTRKGNIFVDLSKKLELYFVGKDIPLEGTLDTAKLDALLTRIAGTLDVPAVNATLVVNNGSIEVMDGKQGNVVDKEALRSSLTDLLFTFHSTELVVPMVVTEPDLSKVDVEPALAQAQVMISGDLLLTFKGKTVATLTPTEIVTYVDVAPGTGNGEAKTVPILSATRMTTLFDTVDKQVSTPGIDATFEMDFNTEPYSLKLVEGVNGEGLDREATAAALTQAAMGTAGRTAEVVLKSVEPNLTTEDVQAMGIKDVLGDYKTTPYVGTKGRQQNVRLATKLCSGVFLAPGEEFNTDQRLGIRDEAHGWALAPGIVGPGKLEDVFGGGICQVSTTLFNAALLAGLEITKRYNHSIYINHYPDGRDATVTAGGKNMCFRNDTDNYIFVYGWSTGINTHFWIWGVADGRKVLPIQFSGFSLGGAFPVQKIVNNSLKPWETKELFAGQRSRSCSITRTVIYADGTKKSVTWSSRWSMMPQVIETGPPAATTTTGGGTPTTDAPTTTTAATS
jgi:vancomycin resistance protein YoaR